MVTVRGQLPELLPGFEARLVYAVPEMVGQEMLNVGVTPTEISIVIADARVPDFPNVEAQAGLKAPAFRTAISERQLLELLTPSTPWMPIPLRWYRKARVAVDGVE